MEKIILDGGKMTEKAAAHEHIAEMMGFPTDWTLLPFLRGAENPSKPTATP